MCYANGIDKRYAIRIITGMVTADTIKQSRQRVGESQADFAKRFGVDQSTIHRWETQGPPRNGTASLIIKRVISELTSIPSSRPASEPAEAQP